MKDLKVIFEIAQSHAELHAIETIGEDVMIYPCGFAWVSLRTPKGKRDPLGKQLEAAGLFSWDDYKKHYYYWVGDYNQSWSHKEAHAKKLAEKLTEELGAKFGYGSRLD